MPIQTLSLKNYGVFRNAELLGLSPLSIVVGANGTGKSTLFDVFSFCRMHFGRTSTPRSPSAVDFGNW